MPGFFKSQRCLSKSLPAYSESQTILNHIELVLLFTHVWTFNVSCLRDFSYCTLRVYPTVRNIFFVADIYENRRLRKLNRATCQKISSTWQDIPHTGSYKEIHLLPTNRHGSNLVTLKMTDLNCIYIYIYIYIWFWSNIIFVIPCSPVYLFALSVGLCTALRW